MNLSEARKIHCWNGEVVRLVFAIELRSGNHSLAGSGVISGEMVHDLMLA